MNKTWYNIDVIESNLVKLQNKYIYFLHLDLLKVLTKNKQYDIIYLEEDTAFHSR